MDKLTEKDLLILEQLSDDYGHPLWMISESIARDKFPEAKSVRSKAKNEQPNLYRRMTKLEELEYVYTVRRNSTRWDSRSKGMQEYPYYINKNLDTLQRIQNAIADQIDGRTKKKYEGTLFRLIHLYFWCDIYVKYIQNAYQKGLSHGDFSLLTPIPPCACCQESQRWMNNDQAHQNRMRIIGVQEKCLIEIESRCHGIQSREFTNPVYLMNLTPNFQLAQQPP